jgi:hypothetical protein
MPVEFISAISPHPTTSTLGFDIDHARHVLPLVRQEFTYRGIAQ